MDQQIRLRAIAQGAREIAENDYEAICGRFDGGHDFDMAFDYDLSEEYARTVAFNATLAAESFFEQTGDSSIRPDGSTVCFFPWCRGRGFDLRNEVVAELFLFSFETAVGLARGLVCLALCHVDGYSFAVAVLVDADVEMVGHELETVLFDVRIVDPVFVEVIFPELFFELFSSSATEVRRTVRSS